MESAEKIAVEVAYALPEKQLILKLEVDPDATLEEVILASGILQDFPEIDLQRNRVGVFGKLGKLGDTLKAGDRIEIYRPLIADPKVVRKRRAEKSKDIKQDPRT